MTNTTALDIWSSDLDRSIAALALSADRPLADDWTIRWAPLDEISAIRFAAPVILPSHYQVVADLLGTDASSVASVARNELTWHEGRAVEPKQLGGESGALPTGVQVLQRALQREPSTRRCAELKIRPEMLVVNEMPVPERAALIAGQAIEGVPSALQCLYSEIARCNARLARLMELSAPKVVLAYQQQVVQHLLERLHAQLNGTRLPWQPVELPANALERAGRESPRQPTLPHRNIEYYSSRLPVDPIDLTFVDGGILVAFPHALAHIELPTGRVLSILPGRVHFGAVSQDGLRVLCRPSEFGRGEAWPVFHVYDVTERAWRTDADSLEGLPPVMPASFVDEGNAELFDLDTLTSFDPRPPAELSEHVVTSHDGSLLWQKVLPRCDELGVLDISRRDDTDSATTRYLLPQSRHPSPEPAEDDDWDDFRARAIARTKHGFAAYADGALYVDDQERYRCSNAFVAAFDATVSRLALANDAALDIVSLAADGTPGSSLRIELDALWPEITLNDFVFAVEIPTDEARILAAMGCVSKAAALGSFDAFAEAVEHASVSFFEDGFEVKQLEPLWKALCERAPSPIALSVSEGPARPALPESGLVWRGFVSPLVRWVSAHGASCRELAAKLVASGAKVRERNMHNVCEDEGASRLCVVEWRLSDAHGQVFVQKGHDSQHVLVLAEKAESLAALGPSVDEPDCLLACALAREPGAASPGYSDLIESGFEESDDPIELAWAVGVSGTQEEVRALAEKARVEAEETDEFEMLDILNALAATRWPSTWVKVS